LLGWKKIEQITALVQIRVGESEMVRRTVV